MVEAKSGMFCRGSVRRQILAVNGTKASSRIVFSKRQNFDRITLL